MARTYASIKVGIWADDDWRTLSGDAQHLYLVLLTSPTLSHCGVADWRPNRIAALVGDWSAATVEKAAAELAERLYVVVDDETEEILLRSFVRHDGLMTQPKMATAMATAHAAVASSLIRGVVVHELRRLRDEAPGLNGWGSAKASELLDKASIDPTVNPSGKGIENPSGKGSGEVIPSPSETGGLLPAPTPTPTTKDQVLSDTTADAVASDAPDKPNAKPRTHRGTRLQAGWKPTPNSVDVLRKKFTHVTVEEIRDEHENFERYWLAKSGRDATKVDWDSTWINWMVGTDWVKVRNRLAQTSIPQDDAKTRRSALHAEWRERYGVSAIFNDDTEESVAARAQGVAS